MWSAVLPMSFRMSVAAPALSNSCGCDDSRIPSGNQKGNRVRTGRFWHLNGRCLAVERGQLKGSPGEHGVDVVNIGAEAQRLLDAFGVVLLRGEQKLPIRTVVVVAHHPGASLFGAAGPGVSGEKGGRR